jgi:hypothetical protein
VEAAHIPWRPLGQLLVEQGILTSSELEQALAKQQETDKRLGETIVDLGFVSGPELSNALAAQYGIELMTEKGFGTGLRSEIQRRHEHSARGTVRLEIVPDQPAEPEASEPVREPELLPQLPAERVLLPQLETQWAKLAAAEAALAEREREVRELRDVNDRLREQLRGETPDAPVADSHLLFVQLDGRYALVPREGPPPLANAELFLPDLDEEGTFVVSGSRPSPLPGDARPCLVAVRV